MAKESTTQAAEAENIATATPEPTATDKIVLAWLQTFRGSAIAGNTDCWNLLQNKAQELMGQLNQ